MSWVGLIPLLPLLAALTIGIRMVTGSAKGETGELTTARIGVWMNLGALLLLLVVDGIALFSGTPPVATLGTWFESGPLQVSISFTLDALSLPVATLVALIAFLTQRFSVNYLHREAGFHRFFFGMSLFTGGMLLIVLSGNAVLAFTGWELAGVSSYLLIGYAYERPIATGNALRAFVTNRVGDAGFLLGIVLAVLWLGTVEWAEMGIRAAEFGTLTAGMLALGFVVAAMAKSALVPFSPWVARALEGPTPSSAIFYGSLMIHAGVYLLIRLQPILEQSPLMMGLIAAIGLLTALYGWFGGLVQTDTKSSLMFATTTQVGLMVVACGLGWFTVAAWYLALHASWRAYQFLVSPSYLEKVGHESHDKAPSRSRGLYTAAIQRFWLEAIADWLLMRPTQSLASDVNTFDQRVVNRLVGLPDTSIGPIRLDSAAASGRDVVRAHGAAGQLLQWAARWLNAFEQHLVFRGDGRLNRVLKRLGGYLFTVESLLERPVYLLLLIMATFAVIL
ncbi:proton-conducting transporter transmembrane domain-containing protein [Thiohalomonas denitrificans]|uniref:NADH-Ubiquinone oxidoreductase (Complex I), chain 5 N-terminus n=1 Tax=Thiohalomonas denitrificans TaxID=415747 RepID=A0A1G5QYX3_9GAMM|nr:proton-conducting transporter membrane subunit [Thiohalomonas denitrificans]SCZ66982.1 NADH-Ubiquinone oxidoreductase (complex I), chain 5 N-terminus [Thiohalomonas denitrificans]